MANKECEYCGHESVAQGAGAPARCGFCGAPKLRKPVIARMSRAAMSRWGIAALCMGGLFWLLR